MAGHVEVGIPFSNSRSCLEKRLQATENLHTAMALGVQLRSVSGTPKDQ